MKTVLVFVSTIDGKVTKWGDPHIKSWTSDEDHKYFTKIRSDASLIIMGSTTYIYEAFRPKSNHRLVVMTSHPDKYKSQVVPDKLEFTSKTPVQLTEYYKNEGHELMLVLGGAHIATSFLKDQLLDEIWLTIEPKIFGIGGNFVIEEKLDINLHLINVEKVNKQGTLIAKYEVLKH
jgi:dihydrofolate reductase